MKVIVFFIKFLLNRISVFFYYTIFFLFYLTFSLNAKIVIDINGGNFNPIPVAISDFLAVDSNGENIASVISRDLKSSGLFKIFDKSVFFGKIMTPDIQPNFPEWQSIGCNGLITGRVTQLTDGRLHVEFRLWDIYGSKQLEGKEFYSSPNSWRRIAHIISDNIYHKMTGEKGYFDTRIVFIDETGPQEKRIKKLAIMDQDGDNLHYLSNDQEMILTPRFSPTQEEITYISFLDGIPRVYLQNLNIIHRELIGFFPNMTISPRFSPDGKVIIMSLLQDNGSSNIYTMNLFSGIIKKLTSGFSIDTSASYSPNGEKIVFSSDRSGKQKLYVMNYDGSHLEQISSGEGSYSTPVWSPRGDYIAFTKQIEGQFSIGVMRPDGSGERILTEGFHNEGPTWAPNGRIIMFFKKNKGMGPRIYTIDITGRNERELRTPNDASDPSWSPLLN